MKGAKLVRGALVFVRFGTAGWQVAEVLALELGKLRGVQVRKWRDNSQRWTTPVWKEAGACFQLEHMSDEQKRRPENARLLRLLERAQAAISDARAGRGLEVLHHRAKKAEAAITDRTLREYTRPKGE